MANPVTAAWNYLRGEDLKLSPPPPPPPRAGAGEVGPEVKQLVFTTDGYAGGLADVLYPTVTAAFGGSTSTWNSAVFACLKVLAYSFQEAPLRVYREQADGTDDWLDEHPLMALLADPHPSLSQPELDWWLVWMLHLSGNAYLRKIRDGGRGVRQLWPISPANMHPETTEPDRQRGVFISHYIYDDGKGRREEVPVEDVVHFRLGVDDADHRLGLSPLRRLLREVASDDEATRFLDDLLKNFAVASLAVTVPPGPVLTEEQATQIRNRLREEYGGAGRGHVAVVANGATLAQVGFNPQQLDLKGAHQHPETRIAAALGVPAMLVGFSVGLEHTTYNNMRQAQEHLFEQTVNPLWRSVAATYTKQLLRPDYAADPRVRLRYDTTDVRALQEDANEVYARVSVAVEKGWMTKDEARAAVGMDPLPDGLGEAQDPLEVAREMAAARGGPPDQSEGEPEQRGRPTSGAALEQKARALAYLPDLMALLQAMARPMLQQDLESYFDQQRERVLAAARNGHAPQGG